MREIKFRAWNNNGKCMVTSPVGVATIISRFIRDFRPTSTGFGSRQSEVTPEDYIPMQFTGLKDKHGKEIYEGDILNYPREEQVISVRWSSDGYWAFYEHRGFDDGVGRGDWRLTTGISLNSEVIGNIYENPELLEDK